MEYLDAVLDSNLNPFFNSTPEETREYLEACKHEMPPGTIVVRGSDLRQMTVAEYLEEPYKAGLPSTYNDPESLY